MNLRNMSLRSILKIAAIMLLVTGTFALVRPSKIEPPVATTATAKPTEVWKYMVADGTDEEGQYATPRLTTVIIARAIDSIMEGGGGWLRIAELDANAANNAVLLLSVPKALVRPIAPLETSTGPTSRRKQRDAFAAKLKAFQQDSARHASEWMIRRAAFLKECDALLAGTYAPGDPDHRRSDVIGSLNKAFNAFRAEGPAGVEVVMELDLFSDLEHNVKGRTLEAMPKGLQVLVVNPAAESSHMVLPDSLITVVDHPEEVFTATRRAGKP